MSKDSTTAKNRNRRIRQEALREQLSQGKHVEHVVEISNKLANLNEELDALEVQRLKAAADIKKGLIAKYIPDLKQSDIALTGEDGGPIKTASSIVFAPVGKNE